MIINGSKYSMIPLGNIYTSNYKREITLIEEEVEDYEFLDFKEMFSEEYITPYGAEDYSPKKTQPSTGSDYYKDYFVSFNPEDDDGLIGGDPIPDDN